MDDQKGSGDWVVKVEMAVTRGAEKSFPHVQFMKSAGVVKRRFPTARFADPCMWVRSLRGRRSEHKMKDNENITVGQSQVVSLPHFATIEECEGWLTKAQADEDFWVTRFDFINVYGVAWYLEIEAGLLNNYHARATETNTKLLALGGLVERLSSVAKLLQSPDKKSGLPIRPRRENLGPYWADAGVVVNTKGLEGQIHADYEGLAPYPQKLFDKDTCAFSAVLSLAKPKVGGNLKIWLERHLGNAEPTLKDFKTQIIDYSVGSLAVFDSFCYHQILTSHLNDAEPIRAIAAMHFLYLDEPYPHWEYWF